MLRSLAGLFFVLLLVQADYKFSRTATLLLLYFLSMEVEPVEDTENTETEQKKQIFFLKQKYL